ncbi:MAG: hypothetical protein WAL98_17615 [Desulfatiglandaceae bacterium]
MLYLFVLTLQAGFKEKTAFFKTFIVIINGYDREKAQIFEMKIPEDVGSRRVRQGCDFFDSNDAGAFRAETCHPHRW